MIGIDVVEVSGTTYPVRPRTVGGLEWRVGFSADIDGKNVDLNTSYSMEKLQDDVTMYGIASVQKTHDEVKQEIEIEIFSKVNEVTVSEARELLGL